MAKNSFIYKSEGFTLAEVLITLVIIGVIAAMTIPTAINNMNDKNFKVAYKKAYADINNAFREDVTLSQFPARLTSCYDSNFANYTYNKLKEKFSVTKACENNNGFECWKQADTYYDANRPSNNERAFIDASGRAWIEFHSGRGFFLVDTNGNKGPNKFGKDRWIFDFFNLLSDGSISSWSCAVDPTKPVVVYPGINDQITKNSLCNYPPCYYRSWLFENK